MTAIPASWNKAYVPLYDRLARPKDGNSYVGGVGFAAFPFRPVFNDGAGDVKPPSFTKVAGSFDDAVAAARNAARSSADTSTFAVFRNTSDGAFHITPMGYMKQMWPDQGEPRTMVGMSIDRRPSRHETRVVRTTVPYESPSYAADVDALVGRSTWFDLRGEVRDARRARFQ